MIKRVLAKTDLANSVQQVDIDAALDGIIASISAEPLQPDPIVEDFIAGQRRFVGQLQELPTLERQMRMLKLVPDQQIDAIFQPLSEMLEAELNLLLSIERNLLIPCEAQRWNGALLEWSQRAELYGRLIGSESRNKSLLRARLGSGKPNAGGPNALQTDALTACLRAHSLPLSMLTAKEEFVTVIIDPSGTDRTP